MIEQLFGNNSRRKIAEFFLTRIHDSFSFDELKKREWLVSEQTLVVKPLERAEKKVLINSYLKQYSKGLSAPLVERIAASEQTANPLYLKALLEELRVFGKYEELERRIGYYLEAERIDDLYEKILERYEGDYERERPGLVRDAMRLLWAARRGLSEAELLELLGTEGAPLQHAYITGAGLKILYELGKEGRPLQHAYWSPLYLAAEQSLVFRSGLIGFSHDYFRKAVLEKYLPAGQDQQAAHLDLADYFETRELGARKIDELP